MNMKKNQKNNIAFITLGLLAMVGTYNAIMINSDSLLSSHDAKNFKRLDEVYGVVVEGRVPAVTHWSKVGNTVHFEAKPVAKSATKVVVAAENNSEPQVQAAIQDSLDLKLVEVINPVKWQQEIKAKQFNGSITAHNGVIESLTANLPEGKSIDISFSEMTGNTFEYDLDGEVYQAFMYQVDQNSFMVTLNNGPLEGTRLRFAGEANTESQMDQTNTYLAENHNVEIGTFGQEVEAIPAPTEQSEVTQTAEVASFNFNQI
jgi:hypothetical protein